MESSIKELIAKKDYEGLIQALSQNPALANDGIPYDDINTTKAPPLHRICDGVFSKTYTDEEAVELAKIFLQYGANIDGNQLIEKKDTPLIAAASLHADRVANLYIQNGANIEHAGCHGGTALHWAAWCGRYAVVRRLAEKGAEINKLCIDFKATPLFWAVHGSKNRGEKNIQDYVECVKTLLQFGADKKVPNADGNTAFDLLNDDDVELKELLN